MIGPAALATRVVNPARRPKKAEKVQWVGTFVASRQMKSLSVVKMQSPRTMMPIRMFRFTFDAK